MIAEPDWGTLADIDFLIHKRLSEHLNAALAAISLIDTQNTAAGTPPEYWRKRAIEQVMKALGTHNAWSSLVRHKMGEKFPQQHMRPFHASELLEWLASELQLNNVPHLKNDVLLWGNPETLKEALLLLHSSAFTLGPGVRLVGKARPAGMWFQVRYKRLQTTTPPPTLDVMLNRLQGHWRARNAAFELKRARDFLNMNGCELAYTVGDEFCELSFFVRSSQSPITTKASTAEIARLASSIADTTPMIKQKLKPAAPALAVEMSLDPADTPPVTPPKPILAPTASGSVVSNAHDTLPLPASALVSVPAPETSAALAASAPISTPVPDSVTAPAAITPNSPPAPETPAALAAITPNPAPLPDLVSASDASAPISTPVPDPVPAPDASVPISPPAPDPVSAPDASAPISPPAAPPAEVSASASSHDTPVLHHRQSIERIVAVLEKSTLSR